MTMPWTDALVLGAVQGVTEALPVSSSMHLLVVRRLLGHAELPRAYDVVLHLGSVGAMVLAVTPELLRRTLPASLDGVAAERHGRLAVQTIVGRLLLATAPAVVFGGLAADSIGQAAGRGRVGALGLTLGSLLIATSEWLSRSRVRAVAGGDGDGAQTRLLWQITPAQALGIGVAQAGALLPGVSRSGATTAAGSLLGLDARTAAHFSALMAIPVMAAAAVRGIPDLKRVAQTSGTAPLLVALTAAFASALVTQIAINRRATRIRRRALIVYRLALAAVLWWMK